MLFETANLFLELDFMICNLSCNTYMTTNPSYLWLPVSTQHDRKGPGILTFADERMFADNSGHVQAAIPIAEDIYQTSLLTSSVRLLKKFGDGAKEFKGINIKSGNSRIFKEFIAEFMNASAALTSSSDLHSIVSIEGKVDLESLEFVEQECLCKAIVEVLNECGISGLEKMASEISRQTLWVARVWPEMTRLEYTNEVELIFDDKYRYNNEIEKIRLLNHPRFSAPLFKDSKHIVTSIVNTAIRNLFTKMPKAMPRVRLFNFVDSPKSFGLQAADVLAHLTYNSLQYCCGIRNNNTELKHGLLSEFVPQFNCDLISSDDFSIVIRDGKEDLVCNTTGSLGVFGYTPLR